MGEHAAHRLVEAAADRLVGHLEVLEDLGVAGADLFQPLLDEVERHAGGVGEEVDPRAVALDRVRPPRDPPVQRRLRRLRRLRQRDVDAVPGRADEGRLDLVRERGRPQARERAAAGVEREVVAAPSVEPARAHHPRVVAALEVASLRSRQRRLVPRVALVDRVAERVPLDERRLVLPVLVEGAAEQDADPEVDLDEVGGDQLAVDDDPGRDEHLVAPLLHVAVLVVDVPGVVEGAPAAEQDAPPADLLVAGQRLVEEVEDVVVHRDRALDEVHAAQQPRQVVGEQRRRRLRADAAGVDRRGVDVATLHQAAHLAREAAHHQRLAVGLADERVERAHDVGDRPVAVDVGVRRLGRLRLRHHARIRVSDHLLAEVDEDEVVLEDRVVEDVLGRLAEVDDPLAQRRRLDAVGHVLGVHRADGVVVAADAADAARDEVRVARVLALHEDAVAAEDRGGAPAADDLLRLEVDLRVDAEVPDDPRDRVPGHVDELPRLPIDSLARGGHLRSSSSLVSRASAAGSRSSARRGCGATSALC